MVDIIKPLPEHSGVHGPLSAGKVYGLKCSVNLVAIIFFQGLIEKSSEGTGYNIILYWFNGRGWLDMPYSLYVEMDKVGQWLATHFTPPSISPCIICYAPMPL